MKKFTDRLRRACLAVEARTGGNPAPGAILWIMLFLFGGQLICFYEQVNLIFPHPRFLP